MNKIMVMISAMFTHGRRWGLLRLASDPGVERAHPMRDGAVPAPPQRRSRSIPSASTDAGVEPVEIWLQ